MTTYMISIITPQGDVQSKIFADKSAAVEFLTSHAVPKPQLAPESNRPSPPDDPLVTQLIETLTALSDVEVTKTEHPNVLRVNCARSGFQHQAEITVNSDAIRVHNGLETVSLPRDVVTITTHLHADFAARNLAFYAKPHFDSIKSISTREIIVSHKGKFWRITFDAQRHLRLDNMRNGVITYTKSDLSENLHSAALEVNKQG